MAADRPAEPVVVLVPVAAFPDVALLVLAQVQTAVVVIVAYVVQQDVLVLWLARLRAEVAAIAVQPVPEVVAPVQCH